jgi:hypothetical protein
MDVETLWYEAAPYIYALAGVISLFFATAFSSAVPGLLLIAAAVTILCVRWVHRRKTAAQTKKAG